VSDWVKQGGEMVGDDSEEFEAYYDSLLRAAYRAAFRLLGERTVAEDVAGEALARAYSHWSSIANHAHPWVVKVATNLALDTGRKRTRAAHHRIELIDTVEHDPHVELRLDLQRALRELPRRQREVVALRFLGDFSEQETADALGLGTGTVKSHASRGLARLRVIVERGEQSVEPS
jgi:RNA polymerase sigma-70 factor (sigma-E family)